MEKSRLAPSLLLLPLLAVQLEPQQTWCQVLIFQWIFQAENLRILLRKRLSEVFGRQLHDHDVRGLHHTRVSRHWQFIGSPSHEARTSSLLRDRLINLVLGRCVG